MVLLCKKGVSKENPNRWADSFLILDLISMCNTRSHIRRTSTAFIIKALTRHRSQRREWGTAVVEDIHMEGTAEVVMDLECNKDHSGHGSESAYQGPNSYQSGSSSGGYQYYRQWINEDHLRAQ
ncbi:PREDICTED: uncharacterized protein LOC105460152, partial [Wasmannia auropunctata]|uniref:uncharacterized protein LOC105460152 n=1 Tax=Wasmannia auropunctata TaxID=64793 RepID=UPI0005EF483A